MPFSTTYANNILNWAMGKSASLSGHNTVYVGLCTNDPEATGGTFTELSGKGYARVLVGQYNNEHVGVMGSADARAVTNTKQLNFTRATDGAWDTVNGYGLFTDKTGGTPFFYAKLKQPVTVPDGAVFLFDPGDLKIDFQTTDVDIT